MSTTCEEWRPMNPIILCSNMECPVRLACERAHRPPEKDQQYESFNLNQEGNPETECPEFLVRAGLGGNDPDLVFREGRRRGRRHNAHAPARESYPGSEQLFGAIFGKQPHRRRGGILARHGIGDEPPAGTELPKRPDLMVKRHIHKGKDINHPSKKED